MCIGLIGYMMCIVVYIFIAFPIAGYVCSFGYWKTYRECLDAGAFIHFGIMAIAIFSWLVWSFFSGCRM